VVKKIAVFGAVFSLALLALFDLPFGASAAIGPGQAAAGGPNEGERLHQRILPVFELAGVVFTDYDETRDRLVVGVENLGLATAVGRILDREGVSRGLVDIVKSEPIVPVATLRDKVRPVVGGLQIRFSQYLCSLGFNAVRNGVAGYVTAAHCSTKQGEVDGTKYYQPLNQVADEFIGTEVADPAFFRNTNGCPRGRRCRHSDSNFSDADDAVLFTLGGIARTTGPNDGSLEIAGSFTIVSEGPATVGQTANKVGRTTGWTQGRVTRTCTDTGVSGTNIVLLCQDFVKAGVDGGDSGSPVFAIILGDNVGLLGNLWGKGGDEFVYSPIANAESELGALTTCFSALC
jgi:hypothetical protein